MEKTENEKKFDQEAAKSVLRAACETLKAGGATRLFVTAIFEKDGESAYVGSFENPGVMFCSEIKDSLVRFAEKATVAAIDETINAFKEGDIEKLHRMNAEVTQAQEMMGKSDDDQEVIEGAEKAGKEILALMKSLGVGDHYILAFHDIKTGRAAIMAEDPTNVIVKKMEKAMKEIHAAPNKVVEA